MTSVDRDTTFPRMTFPRRHFRADISAQMNFFSSVYVELMLEKSPGLLQESSGMLRKSPMMLQGSSMILEGSSEVLDASPGMLEGLPGMLEDCLRCLMHHL